MKTQLLSTVGLALAVHLLLVSPCEGGGRVRLDTRYERWTWEMEGIGGDAVVGEMTTRLSLGLTLMPGVDAEVTTGYAGASWSGPQTEAGSAAKNLSGMLDTKLRLTYRVGDRLLMRVGLNGPTGTTELSAEELPLAQALASRALSFDGNRLGGGFDVDLGVSFATNAGPAAVGLGAGYLLKGGYTIREETETYEPGDQVSLAGGIDLSNPAWLWRGSVRAILYQADRYDAVDFYEAGDRYDGQMTLLHRWAQTSLWGSLCLVSFGDTKEVGGDGLSESESRTLRGEYYAEAGMRYETHSGLKVSPTVGLRILRGTNGGEGKARRVDLGLATVMRLSPRAGLEVKGRYGLGRLEQAAPELTNPGESDLSGLAGAVSLMVDF
ncbi:MAG: hypothetical protein FJY88_09565 [Candidatus Eisenbacteria bacterium]|nr:hypothetical protein [Candidatus Eisenbacteria bacterium]